MFGVICVFKLYISEGYTILFYRETIPIYLYSDSTNINNKKLDDDFLFLNTSIDSVENINKNTAAAATLDFLEFGKLFSDCQAGMSVCIFADKETYNVNNMPSNKPYVILSFHKFIYHEDKNYFVLYYVFDLDEAIKIADILYLNHKIDLDHYTEIKLTNDFTNIGCVYVRYEYGRKRDIRTNI